MVNGYFYSGEDATACQGPPMRNNSLFKYKRSEESLHCCRGSHRGSENEM